MGPGLRIWRGPWAPGPAAMSLNDINNLAPGPANGHQGHHRGIGGAPQGNRQGTTGEQAGQYNYQFQTKRILFTIFRMFIKFGIMGWIWIDFALLNAFAN